MNLLLGFLLEIARNLLRLVYNEMVLAARIAVKLFFAAMGVGPLWIFALIFLLGFTYDLLVLEACYKYGGLGIYEVITGIQIIINGILHFLRDVVHAINSLSGPFGGGLSMPSALSDIDLVSMSHIRDFAFSDEYCRGFTTGPGATAELIRYSVHADLDEGGLITFLAYDPPFRAIFEAFGLYPAVDQTTFIICMCGYAGRMVMFLSGILLGIVIFSIAHAELLAMVKEVWFFFTRTFRSEEKLVRENRQEVSAAPE